MPTWLKCKLSKGMFSDEFTVIVQTLSGELVSVFVPKDSTEESRNWVKVYITEKSGHNFAMLPNEQQTIVEVNSNDIVAI